MTGCIAYSSEAIPRSPEAKFLVRARNPFESTTSLFFGQLRADQRRNNNQKL